MTTDAKPPSSLVPELPVPEPGASPLSEADPKSLDELMLRLPEIFAKPPLDLSEAEIEAGVRYLRNRRAQFLQDAATQAANPKTRAARKPKPASVTDALAVDLDQL